MSNFEAWAGFAPALAVLQTALWATRVPGLSLILSSLASKGKTLTLFECGSGPFFTCPLLAFWPNFKPFLFGGAGFGDGNR